MAKLVDALPSGGSVRKDVQVRILFWARSLSDKTERLSYYVRFVLDNELNVRTEEKVVEVDRVFGEFTVPSADHPAAEASAPLLKPGGESGHASLDNEGSFRVVTDKSEYLSRNVLFAIGAMDYPRKLNVPGEDLPKVRDHFHETYPWVKKHALIVGGGNSAGEAARMARSMSTRIAGSLFSSRDPL